MRITKILLIVLFFLLPFIHGKLLPTIGIDYFLEVSGNFEFSKSIFLNVFSGIILFSFVGESIYKRKSICIPIYTYFLVGLLFVSTVFSLSPFMSLIGDTEKGHTTLMFFNLISLFVVLKNIEKPFLRKLILISLISGVLVAILAIKELVFPSFEYGELSNRALGSFGHPNYLAGYLLLLLPLTSYLANKAFKLVFLGVFITTIFLSQSILALFLAGVYLLYIFWTQLFGKKIFYVALLGVGALLLIGFALYIPEKFHSFLSRFYLWETTVKIIFSDIKILLIGAGSETLPYYFDAFKVPEAYIFENFGYTADRPHNFFLNIFFHFGIFVLSGFLYLIYKFKKSCKSVRLLPEKVSIILFLVFGIFHFFSLTSYLLVILCITLILPIRETKKQNHVSILVIGCIFILSLVGGYYSLKLYQAEVFSQQSNYQKADKTLSHPKYLIELGEYKKASELESVASQNNFRQQILMGEEREKICESLIQSYPSVENYFYCGKILEMFGNETVAIEYYNAGANKLPDLWNESSPYWNNYFVKHTITGNRFFSEKFSDISEIIKKLETIK